MDTNTDLEKIKQLVGSAKDILVLTHEHPTADSVGSALALSLGLTSLGKKVVVACPDAMTVELSSFVGVNKIATDLVRKNFVISLDYVDGSIEKVSYNIEGDKFNLVIEPRVGFAPFTADKVHYATAGAGVDLIITVNTIHLGGLKKLYEGDKELFATKPIVVIDRHPNNAHYGQVNLVDGTAATTAELVARVLDALGVVLNPDIATNLLNALFEGTHNFTTPAVTVAAFDVAAACVKAGGKRFSQPEQGNHEPASLQQVKLPAPAVTTNMPPTSPAPADWLKPKIFKSSNLL